MLRGGPGAQLRNTVLMEKCQILHEYLTQHQAWGQGGVGGMGAGA